MNIYFAIAIFLTVVLGLLILWNNTDTSYKSIEEKYEQLDDEGKRMADQLLNKFLEAEEKAREKRRAKLAKVIASNQYIWAIAMFIWYKFFMSEDERKSIMKDIAKKHPHLKEPMKGKKFPWN